MGGIEAGGERAATGERDSEIRLFLLFSLLFALMMLSFLFVAMLESLSVMDFVWTFSSGDFFSGCSAGVTVERDKLESADNVVVSGAAFVVW